MLCKPIGAAKVVSESFSRCSTPLLIMAVSHRGETGFTTLGQAVLLQTAGGFIEESVFNQPLLHQFLDRPFEGSSLDLQPEQMHQFSGR